MQPVKAQIKHYIMWDLIWLYSIFMSHYIIFVFILQTVPQIKKKQSVNVFFWCVFFCVCGGGRRTLNIQKDRHAKNIVIQVFKVCQSCND